MICFDSQKTIDILLENIPILKKRWARNREDIFLKMFEQNRSHFFSKKNHKLSWKETSESYDKKINILFAHFSLAKYEMEAIEMPLYASKFFSNEKTNIDICYFDSRGNIDKDRSKVYLQTAKRGTITIPKKDNDFLDSYDLLITRSSTISRMRKYKPDVLNSCNYKINIQTNNYAPNLNIGENYRFCYTDFFAPAGRRFTDRANNIISSNSFKKMNLIVMCGTVVWWKGQAEWIENVDPELLKEYVVVILGSIADSQYCQRIINAAKKKNINLLYSQYVNPDFLCDVLSFSRIKIINSYADPGDGQPALGPSRTFGEAIACHNICLHGQTFNPDNKEGIGKNIYIPEEWKDYTIEYDQNIQKAYNEALERAISTNILDVDFQNAITVEEKCNQIFKKCLNRAGI